MEPASTFLVFAVGPVQGFIAESRRTADSWVGSFLLSYLSAHAATALQEQGARIIAPDCAAALCEAVRKMAATGTPPAPGSLNGNTALAGLPNTVLAQVSDPESAGEKARRSVECQWQVLVNQIATALRAHGLGGLLSGASGQIWERQLAAPWEIYCAWGTDSTEAYRALGARKGLRDFAAVEESGERCTVCGHRQALANDMNVDVKDQWRAWARGLCGKDLGGRQNTPRSLLKAGGQERLCAFCLVKRVIPWTSNAVVHVWDAGKETPDRPWVFPSTSTMTTVLYKLELIEEPALKQSIGEFVQAIRDSKIDGQTLFARADSVQTFLSWEARHKENPWAKDALEIDGNWYLYGDAVRNEYGLDDETDSGLTRAHRKLMEEARKAGVQGSPIYYALLTMDADGMGDLHKRIANDVSALQRLSCALGAFAADVSKIVRKHDGRAVYSGGDDVLAFLPLTSALECADKLRNRFAEILCQKDFPDQHLSGSIVYAHHLAPLGAVICEGHQRVKMAKQLERKDAVALVQFRRGGPALAMAAHWDIEGKPLADRMKDLAGKQKGPNKGLSTSIGHALRDYEWILGSGDLEEQDWQRLLVSILRKSRLTPDGTPEEKERRTAEAAEEIRALCRSGVSFQVEPLLMARFLAGEGREERE